MNKNTILWIVLILLLAGVASLGTLLYVQNQRLTEMSGALSLLATQKENAPSVADRNEPPSAASDNEFGNGQGNIQDPDGFPVLGEKSVQWGNITLVFRHRCSGSIKSAPLFGDTQTLVGYCVGDNQLTVDDGSGQIVLDERNAEEAVDAPLLLKAEAVQGPSSAAGAVLLSYSKEPCTTTNDCGQGMPTNYVRYAYDPSTRSIRPLAKYPDRGSLVWNSRGDRAVFIPMTCGGGGCIVAPLIGYNLASDTVKDVTTAKAAGTGLGYAEDVNGRGLPVWKSITWTGDTTFEATINNPDGSSQKTRGTF